MATKLEKTRAELEKARIRLTDWTRRVKELEQRYQEEENTAIHDIVHAANLTPEQLAEILALAAKGMVGVYPDQMHVELEEEENANEKGSEEEVYETY